MKADFEDGYTSLAFVSEVDMSECLAAAVLSLESRYATPYLCCVEMACALVCMLFGHVRSSFFQMKLVSLQIYTILSHAFASCL